MAVQNSLSASSPVDIEGLFKKFTVSEISNIQRNLKSDVERKKEDLRQMVGRRYRDIIEAADSIKTMKETSDNILGNVKEIQQNLLILCNHPTFSSVGGRDRFGKWNNNVTNHQECKFAGKLMTDLYEMTYELLDDNCCKDAMFCVLLAEYLFNQFDSKMTGDQASRFGSMWRQLQKSRGRVALQANQLITSEVLSNEMMLDAVLTTTLLNPSLSSKQLCERVFELRLEAISAIYTNQDISSKEQLTSILQLIIPIPSLINECFLVNDTGYGQNNLAMIMDKCFKGGWQPDEMIRYISYQGRNYSNFVSKIIGDFQDHFCSDGSFESLILSRENCADATQQFIRNANNLSDQYLSTHTLKFVECVSHLTKLKLHCQSMLNESYDDQKWNSVCKRVIGDELNIWKVFMQRHFDNKLKILIANALSQSTIDLIESTKVWLLSTSKYDTNISSERYDIYLWKELTSDVPSVTERSRTSTLTLKSRFYTDDVYRLCHSFSTSLASIETDFNEYLSCSDGDVSTSGTSTDDSALTCNDAVRQSIEKCIKNLATELTHLAIQEESETAELWMIKLVNCAKLASCLLDVSTELKSFVQLVSPKSLSTNQQQQQRSGGSGDNEMWHSVSATLLGLTQHLLVEWADAMVKQTMKPFKQIMTMFGQDLWLRCSQEWEMIHQNDADTEVNAEFILPVRPSPFIDSLLNALCNNVNGVGVHALPKVVVEKISQSAVGELAEIYSEYFNLISLDKLAKPLAKQGLQMAFDLQIIKLVLDPKSTSSGSQLDTFIIKTESIADPFDLDMLFSQNKKIINRLLYKCVSLYGCLLLPDVYSSVARLGSQVKSNANTTDSSQIITLNQSVKRFQLLPVASDLSGASNIGSSTIAKLRKTSSDRTSFSDESNNSNLVSSGASLTSNLIQKSAASIYDRISNSWFAM